VHPPGRMGAWTKCGGSPYPYNSLQGQPPKTLHKESEHNNLERKTWWFRISIGEDRFRTLECAPPKFA